MYPINREGCYYVVLPHVYRRCDPPMLPRRLLLLNVAFHIRLALLNLRLFHTRTVQ